MTPCLRGFVVLLLGVFFAATPVHAGESDCREHRGQEMTPWGTASVTERACPTREGGVRITHEYHLAKAGSLAPQKLPAMKAFFLRQHKCVAETVAGQPLADAAGRVWPQLQLSGHCAAAERFQTVFLLADGRLFRMTVTAPLFGESRLDMKEVLRTWLLEIHVREQQH